MSNTGLRRRNARGITRRMILFIRLLRPIAYLLGISGALVLVNAHDDATKKIGWGLIIAMIPFFIAVNVLTTMQAARQKYRHRRRP